MEFPSPKTLGESVEGVADPKTAELLVRLRRRFGWSDSEIIRRGIRALFKTEPSPRPMKIVGVGEFASGVDDFLSKADPLRGFGS